MARTATPAPTDRHARAGAERRMTRRLIKYWDMLRGRRAYPSLTEFDVEAVPGFADNAFVLDLTRSVELPFFRYIGRDLARECPVPLIGRNLSEAPRPSLVAQVADHYLKVIVNRMPLEFEGTLADGFLIPLAYRGTMLPLSIDRISVDALVGAISWKTAD